MPKTKTKSKSRNRPGPARSQRPDIPVLPIVVGGVFAALLIGFVIYARLNPGSTSTSPPAAKAINGIRCDTNEQLAFHIHDHLEITRAGAPVSVPANLGIRQDANCIYWLHTHDPAQIAGDNGVIHMEAPADQAKRALTLGDFFAIWANSNGQSDFKLTRTQVGQYKLKDTERLAVIVDGQAYTGDPAAIVLNDGDPPKGHKLITLEILDKDTPEQPQAPFTFPKGE